MFYGAQLFSAAGACRVDSHVELVGIGLEDWGVISPWAVKKNCATPRNVGLAINWP